MIWFVLYIRMAVLWSVFSARSQVKHHPHSNTTMDLFLVILVNFVFAPITMAVAIVNPELW